MPSLARIAFISLLLSASAFAWQSSTGNANHPTDEAAIKGLWAKFESGFNRGDWKTCASVFTVDGDRMDSFGEFFHGRAAIEQSYIKLFSGAYKSGTTNSTMKKLRFVTPDVAIADLDSEVHLPGQPVRLLQATTVYVRQNGTWFIAAHRPRVRAQLLPQNAKKK
jgi:uncharacterized protein (TIGR02246 family)